MRWLELNGRAALNGTLKVQGSKNSSLALLVASCLAGKEVVIENVPDISDIRVTADLLRSTGAGVSFSDNAFTIDPSSICNSIINAEASQKVRVAYYFVGALLARQKHVAVGYPGGDDIGPRNIDQHIKGFKALGAKVTRYNDYYVVKADKLVGNNIYFDLITCGATINVMLAAVLAKGRTVIYNAARDPEVVDVAVFLNKMGAYITGAGTDTIKIRGVESLGGCVHQCIADRIVSGTLLMAAGITGGDIKLEGAEIGHLGACVDKLAEIGLEITRTDDDTISARSSGILKAANITTGMYPLFATDFQQSATVLLLCSNGRSTVTELVYPDRFKHCVELNRMGADIRVRRNKAFVNGVKMLRGADVAATDIRGGIALTLAALAADGRSRIFGVENLERGFENIVPAFNSLGADLRIVEEAESAYA
ncbi:MAG: UDP-N-acetylglucosamine 1-carboxyvinyltransferase [Clostridiales bacterium]|jgi:UDP-N-acetylglucosamine 1-carboxyvinyltransferase|nr:UDP-N-acetylglucosamine 1-carboxyvinyltransferase [Clostridiales bacterium]